MADLKYGFLLLLFLSIGQSLTAQERPIRVISESSSESLIQAVEHNRPTDEYEFLDYEDYLRMAATAGDTITISYVGYRDTNLVIRPDVMRYLARNNDPCIVDRII